MQSEGQRFKCVVEKLLEYVVEKLLEYVAEKLLGYDIKPCFIKTVLSNTMVINICSTTFSIFSRSDTSNIMEGSVGGCFS